MRNFRLLSCLAVVGLCLNWIVASVENRPNFIIVMTDDQGFGDLGVHGNDQIDTP